MLYYYPLTSSLSPSTAITMGNIRLKMRKILILMRSRSELSMWLLVWWVWRGPQIKVLRLQGEEIPDESYFEMIFEVLVDASTTNGWWIFKLCVCVCVQVCLCIQYAPEETKSSSLWEFAVLFLLTVTLLTHVLLTTGQQFWAERRKSISGEKRL